MKKRILSILLAVVMIVGMLPVAAFAATEVSYLEWDDAQKKLVETSTSDYTVYDGETTLAAGTTYVVDGTFTVDTRITVNGTAVNPTRIVLKDGAKLTANAGIEVAAGSALIIYGQSEGTGTVTATGSSYAAGIGGGDRVAGGIITVNGGTVTATSVRYGAGIGGGYYGNGGTVTVNGGTVTAIGTEYCKGIGGGYEGIGGGTVTVNGGVVNANGTYGGSGIDGDTVTINGGVVNATAIRNDSTGVCGIAIGKNYYVENQGTIKITDTARIMAGDAYPGEVTEVSAYIADHSAKYVHIDTQKHTYTYTSSGATLIATCSETECHWPDHKLTLTLTGKGFDQTELKVWVGEGAAEPVITYYKADDLTNPISKPAATDSGEFTVKATVGTGGNTATATVDFAQLPYNYKGDGQSPETAYELYTVSQLEDLAHAVNGTAPYESPNGMQGVYFKLTADIGTAADPVTTIIGNMNSSFAGHFDGAGHTVTLNIGGVDAAAELANLDINIDEMMLEMLTMMPDRAETFLHDLPAGVTMEQVMAILSQGPQNSSGLFGQLGSDGEIKNVTTAGSVNGLSYVGGVCGRNDNGTVTGCTNVGSIDGNSSVGGVCGYNTWTIDNCTNTGRVNGNSTIGGVCGENGSRIINCTNTGRVNGNSMIGGVCGSNMYMITNCYNIGNVSGDVRVGGVCGANSDTITNCYNTGTVSGEDHLGGVCGYNLNTITNCYYNSTVYSGNVSGWGDQGTASYGLPTEQMQAAAGSTLSTGVANNKPLVDLLNEYVNNNPSAGLKSWVNKQGEYPVFGTPHTHAFSYKASGTDIIASCTNVDCDLPEGKITLTLTAAGGTYDGENSFAATLADKDAFVAATGATVGDILYSGTGIDDTATTAPTNAGSYTAKVTVTYGESQTATLTKAFTVAKAAQTVTADAEQSFTYGDTDKAVSASALDSAVLTYAVKSGDSVSVNAKTGALTINKTGDTVITVTAAATDNYNAATKDVTIKIAAKKLTKPTAVSQTYTYNTNEQTFAFTEGTFDADTMSVENNKKTDAGTYTVTVTPKDNYAWSTEGNCTFSWVIGKANYTGTKTASGNLNAYKDSTATITLPDLPDGASYGTVTGKNNVTGSVSDTNKLTLTAGENIAAGTAAFEITVAVTGAKNYNDYTVTVTVTPVFHTHSFTYEVNGATVTATCGNEATPCTLEGNKISLTLTADGGTYDGVNSFPATTDDATVKFTETTGATVGEIEYYKGGAKQNGAPTDAGNYTAKVTVTYGDSQTITAEKDFTVEKAELTVTAKNKSIVYGDAAANNGVKYTGFVNGETEAKLGGTLTYAYKQSVTPFANYTTTSPVGTYDIIPSGLTSDNYKISFVNGTLTVNRADITPEVSITGWTYGNTANDPSVTGNSGSGAVTYEYKVKNADDSTYTTDVPTNAGDYTVRATVAETTNYNGGSDTADFTIEKATWATPTAITEGYTVNYDNETITVKAGYELSLSDTFVPLITTETGIDFTKTYYLRKAADNNHNASEGTFFSFTRPAAPAASAFTMTGETVENKKDGSFSGITAAMEYSTDNGTTWAPGPKTLTGLSNETVKVRYKATTAAFKSSEYSYTFTASTAKLTVNINGTETQIAYGQKLSRPDPNPEQTGYTFGGWYSDEELTQAWNFAVDTVTNNMTLYPKWIRNNVQKAVITGNVTEDSSNVIGATVELFLGTVKVAATVTNDSGNYSFDNVEDGIYNIVVTKADGKTKTELVTVNSTGSFTADVALPAQNVNSVVEHKGNEVPNTKSDINETVVGGLDIIASNTDAGSNKVTIKLTVEPKAESEVTGASDIKALAGSGKKVEFLDLSLWEITTTDSGELIGDIGNANSALLTIVIPFDFSGVNVSSVTILRQHGTDSAEPLTKNPAAGQEGFTVNATEGTITIYAKKFSTYAMAYAEQSTGGHGGGSYTPGHTVTADLKSVTKVTIDGKTVDSRYYTVNGGTVYLTGEFMKTLTNGKHTVKLYDGLKVATGTITVTGNMNVISAPTGDAGLALYAALSVSSVLGMGWVSRKKPGKKRFRSPV